ncbi:unnamed protein product [Echinostoma caproni]|uniref:Rab3 GTPase-activating protein catalytic subunit n=1 Tax=Echinostoma caproni TaxID=27848 RepID=A0A183AKP8_9TREM|nr:unnamed protein product [Echinostoma caproni]
MGGFKLTKWMSNSRHAIDCIPVDERAPSLRELYGSPLPTDRALGVQWDSEKDEFLSQLQLHEKALTRRGILSSLASLYDPMGAMEQFCIFIASRTNDSGSFLALRASASTPSMSVCAT